MKAVASRFIKYWVPVIVVCTAIFTSSSIEEPVVEVEVRYFDKFVHLATYAILGYFVLRALREYQFNLSGISLLIVAIALTTFYGIADEIHQSYVPGRITSVADVVFDFFGSLLGTFIYGHRRRVNA